MAATIASAAASAAHRWFAAGIGLLLVAGALGALSLHPVMPAFPGFSPMVAAAFGLSGAVTAYLLFGQFLLSGVPALALLAAAYLLGAVMSALHTLVAQAVPLGVPGFSGGNAAAWLWQSWHLAQPLLLLVYALAARSVLGRPDPTRPRALWVALLLGVALALPVGLGLATALFGALPDLEAGTAAQSTGWAVMLLDAGVLVAFTAVTRCRTRLETWLAVTLLAFLLEAVLAQQPVSFSLGWYAAGFYGLLAGATLLVVTCHEVTMLYGRLDQLNHRLEQLASTDRLSGLANRRQFDQRLGLEWRRAQRERAPVSIGMIDIDYFKLFNDSYGHLQGDQCIRRVAQAIAATARRPADLTARYGGEEFAVIMAGTDEAGAELLAQRIAEAVRAEGIRHQKNAPGIVTVSIGVSTYRPGLGDHKSWLIEAADNALYEAKHQGRDRVVVGRCQPSVIPAGLAAQAEEEEAEDQEIAGAG